MNITFRKKPGNPELPIAFFWKITVDTKSPLTIQDHVIPELFFDYFFIQQGNITCMDENRGRTFTLPGQSLKTLQTHPLTLVLSTPLVLYGARLALRFGESFWGKMDANCFSEQAWLARDPKDLDSFRSQVEEYFACHRIKKSPYPMLKSTLKESDWLVHYSARHKRRLYREIFGLSRKELQNISNVQAFLEQACDFGSQSPRIIRHVNPDVFYDQPHLNHMFRKMTGFSPIEYFEANSILQDNLMSASYNEVPGL